jgi:DNA-binding transcriptional regulator YhcF (GntR family)
MEFKNGKSIALQIADNISEKILQGSLPEKGRIPSVRELAADMGVNPNTIVRTYAELQSREIISNQRGIGYFVNEKARSIINDWRKREFFENQLPEFVKQMKVLGITYEDLQTPISNLMNETDHENK